MSSLPTLCHRVRLYISIVVLAGPDEASLRFHGLGHHVVDETVLIPDTFGLKLSTIFPEHTRRWTTPLSCDLHLQMCVLAIAKERDRVCMCCAKDSQVLTSRRSPGRCLWSDHRTSSGWCSWCWGIEARLWSGPSGRSCGQSPWWTYLYCTSPWQHHLCLDTHTDTHIYKPNSNEVGMLCKM